MNFILWATVWRRLVIHLLSVSLPAVCVAQVPQDKSGTTSGTISEASLAIERDSLETFLDSLVGRCMEKFHVPGVVVVVVHAGETVIAKGYGYADLEKKTAVDPDKTLFRVASVSKPFAATAENGD